MRKNLVCHSFICIVARRGVALSVRQLAVLTTVHTYNKSHTIRSLSKELQVQKPAISRAVTSLCKMGFLHTVQDKNDKRSIIVLPNMKGKRFMHDVAVELSKLDG